MYSIALFNTSQTNFTYGKVTSPIHFLVWSIHFSPK
jgi:hypothetical protein